MGRGAWGEHVGRGDHADWGEHVGRGATWHTIGTLIGVAVGTVRREVVPLGPNKKEVRLENLDIPERLNRLDHMSASPNTTSQADGWEMRPLGQP